MGVSGVQGSSFPDCYRKATYRENVLSDSPHYERFTFIDVLVLLPLFQIYGPVGQTIHPGTVPRPLQRLPAV